MIGNALTVLEHRSLSIGKVELLVLFLGKPKPLSICSLAKQTIQTLNRFDHIVLERYPSFEDALRDMDDALCMIFMFSRLPKSSTVHAEMIENCRRLSMEWMNYWHGSEICNFHRSTFWVNNFLIVFYIYLILYQSIHAQCLRKCFVSIRGYYYQAEVRGETITWLVPHEFAQEHNEDVDYRVMRTFTDFYLSAASFVLYKDCDYYFES